MDDEREEPAFAALSVKGCRKVHRKQAKALKILKKDFPSVSESKTATRNVMVCNAGLVTGTSRYLCMKES